MVRGCAPSQEIYEFFISKWRDMVQSGCVVFEIHVSRENYQRLAVFRSSAEGKNKTLVKILGVVNSGRPLQVKYWGVATPAALTPMRRKHLEDGLVREPGRLVLFVAGQPRCADVLRRNVRRHHVDVLKYSHSLLRQRAEIPPPPGIASELRSCRGPCWLKYPTTAREKAVKYPLLSQNPRL